MTHEYDEFPRGESYSEKGDLESPGPFIPLGELIRGASAVEWSAERSAGR
jgi:hypothetical protein